MRVENKVQLLTDDDRIAKLDELFATRLPHRGKLQLPTTKNYDNLSTDAGLKELSSEIFRWLGIKPGHLEVSFAALNYEWQAAPADHTIRINQQYKDHPYAAAAYLTLAVVSYCIERYDNDRPDQSLVEFASIYSGLGLWIVNALRPQMSIWQSLYHAVDGTWFKREGMRLSSYSKESYAMAVVAYAHQNRMAPESYLSGVAVSARHLLPDFVTSTSMRSLGAPLQLDHHRRSARQMWTKLALIALIVSTALTIGAYLLAQRTPSQNPEQIEAQQALQIIKQSLESCTQKASDQQSTYDPNDLFMTRQVDATKSRCESLRNEYNYALDQYQRAYSD